MVKPVGAEPSLPRTAKCWIRYHNNIPGENSETYYRRSIANPVKNDYKFSISNVRQKSCINICFVTIDLFISWFRYWTKLRKTSSWIIQDCIYFSNFIHHSQSSEVKLRDVQNIANIELNQLKKINKNWKLMYQLLEPSDSSFINALQMTDPDSFPSFENF